MDLISVVIVLIIIGLVLWLVERLPLDAGIVQIIRVVVIVAVILWLLSLIVPFGSLRIGRPGLR